MKLAERILIGLILIGLIFKILHWPGGSIFMVLGFGLLAKFYIIAAYFIFSPVKLIEADGMVYKNTSAPRVALALTAGISLAVALIGILFRFMHWPGAAVMLLIGLISIVPIAVIATMKLTYKKEAYYKEIAIRSIVIGSLSLLMFAYGVLPF